MDSDRRAIAAPEAADAGPAYKVNVLERSISVLQAFTFERPHMTLAEISRATSLHRSTVLRLLSTLAHAGLVIRDGETGQYALGYEIIAMAEVARAGSGVANWAHPVMKEISDRLNETVVLSVRLGDYRVDIEQVVGNQAIRRVVTLGEHKLLTFGAPSLSIMSGLPEAEARQIVERLRPQTLQRNPDFDEAEYFRRIEAVRRNGYHEQRSQFGAGSWSGSVGVAGPVFGRRGEVVASLGISVPSGRMTPELLERVKAEVLQGCVAVGALLGRRGKAA